MECPNLKCGAKARYEAGQVVLAEVDHVKTYRGETDELLHRMRSAEAETEFMDFVLDGHMEPDWFVERWLDGEKVLVACCVFEKEDVAKACGDALRDAFGRGELKHVRPRDDAAMAADVAAYFSAEWEKAHAAEMARVDAAYGDAARDFGGRILVGWIGGGMDAEKRKRRFDEFGKQVKGVAGGLVAHAGLDDDLLGRVDVALGFENGDAAQTFLASVADMRGTDDVCLSGIGGEAVPCDVLRQMAVAMAKRLKAHDGKVGG